MILTDRKSPSDRIILDKGTARTIDAQGFMHVKDCNISKANVCPYLGSEIPNAEELGLDPNKIYKLYRDPEELAKAAPTFNNLPLMDFHHEVDAEGLETDAKLHGKVVGSIGTDCRFVAPYLVASLVLYTAGAIAGVESEQQRELSPAYRYTLDMTPGTSPEGEVYDGVMRNIGGNHVALVDEGRTGKDVTIKDGAMKRPTMADGIRAAFARDANPVITDLVSKLTALKAEVTEKLKPGAGEEDGKALDDCTSAIDLAVHHLLDVEEDADEATDDNPEGVNQYTGAAASARAASTKARTTNKKSDHLNAAKAHVAAAHAAAAEGKTKEVGHHAGAASAHTRMMRNAQDSMAQDVIKHMKGHRDSSGKPAPWVIVSEKTGKVLWSGGSKEEAVSNLRRIKGHASDSITAEDDNPEGINQYTGAAKAASKAANAGKPGQRSALHAKAAELHKAAASEAKRAGQHGSAAYHAKQARGHEHVSAVEKERETGKSGTKNSKSWLPNYSKAEMGHDSITADIEKREDVRPKQGVSEYGEVKFADEKNKKYPIDTAAHVRAAASYFGRAKNRNKYSKEDRAKIDQNIAAASRKFKIGANAESK